jgi:hypothetical protein
MAAGVLFGLGAWPRRYPASAKSDREESKKPAGSDYLPSQNSRFLRMYSRHLEGTVNSSKIAFTGQTDSQ